MTKNDILDQVFEAAAKLELMQTVLSVLINTVEKEEATTQEKALHFAANQNMIGDFLHIVLDGVCSAIRILNKVQDGDSPPQDFKPSASLVNKVPIQDKIEKAGQDGGHKNVAELPLSINNHYIINQIEQLLTSISEEDRIQ